MYAKLIVAKVAAWLFYLAGCLWFFVAMFRLSSGSANGWPTLLQCFSIIVTGLLIDVLTDIGINIIDFKDEQEQIKAKIERLKP